MAAFSRAVHEWKADMLEMDVRSTSDGEVVVIHDDTVDRTTDGSGRVAELPWSRIRELDAGYRFLDPRGRPTFRGVGVRIPLFQEVLERLPGVRLNVETKDGVSASRLVQMILEQGAEDRVLVAAEVERNRRAVLGYPGPWGASRAQLSRFFFAIHSPWNRRYTPSCDALQVPETHWGIRVLKPRFLREAHRRNLPVHVWTVDDPGDMLRFLEMGVDGIQTDRPDLLARVLVDRVGRPPPPGLGADP
jgi:glycerophosphoryl diester phosphodiesterase